MAGQPPPPTRAAVGPCARHPGHPLHGVGRLWFGRRDQLGVRLQLPCPGDEFAALDQHLRALVPQPHRMVGEKEGEIERGQSDVGALGAAGRPLTDVVQHPQDRLQRGGGTQHRLRQRVPGRTTDQQLSLGLGEQPAAGERVGQHQLPVRPAESDDVVSGQRHSPHRGAGTAGDLQPHHGQQDRQSTAPAEHLVQKRGAKSLVVVGGAAEAEPVAEQLGQVLGPLLGGAVGRVRQQPGESVELDLPLVHRPFDLGGVGRVRTGTQHRAQQQAQQGEIGLLGARRLGEPLVWFLRSPTVWFRHRAFPRPLRDAVRPSRLHPRHVRPHPRARQLGATRQWW